MNEDIRNEAHLFEQYMKDWADLYVDFCITSVNKGWDEHIFKTYFTFDRWKKGYTEVNTSVSCKGITWNESVEPLPPMIRVKYNIFHFRPFNIRYSIDDYNSRAKIKH